MREETISDSNRPYVPGALESIDYHYDGHGTLASLSMKCYNRSVAEYYYLRNTLGDVVALCDAVGNIVAAYEYDAWGGVHGVYDGFGLNRINEQDFVGNLNPIRYRGYYYDTETALYYLQSRYFDPGTGRFVNADSVIDSGHSLFGHNLYAYGNNNPVNCEDSEGTMPTWVGTVLKIAIGAAVIAALAMATVATGGAVAVICGAALSGAIAGGASGAVMGAVGGIFTGGGWRGALDGAASGFMTGTIIGAITGAASAGVNIATGSTQIIGSAHGSTLHKLSTNMQAGKVAASGNYTQIGLNKSLKTMGLNGTSRPDVIEIGKNGVNKLVEVVSPKQSASYIASKMNTMLQNNPGSTGKVVRWVGQVGKIATLLK